jgi:1-acyl-sn-glycerol-3-phosphate acyltransferase
MQGLAPLAWLRSSGDVVRSVGRACQNTRNRRALDGALVFFPEGARSSRFKIFPEGVRGSASTTSTDVGHL